MPFARFAHAGLHVESVKALKARQARGEGVLVGGGRVVGRGVVTPIAAGEAGKLAFEVRQEAAPRGGPEAERVADGIAGTGRMRRREQGGETGRVIGDPG